MKNWRNRRVKRRNPLARLLRDSAFRARREANRKKYSRKLKHRRKTDRDGE
ncbi:MAG: DUF7230 family protein [Geminicoccaceae bacterium]